MSDYWERCPNLNGRERGPIYRRTLAGIQFKLTPHWRPTRRYSGTESKVVNERGTPLIKDGYEIEGMPELRVRGSGQKMLRLAPTLSIAKASCERFATEVEEGKRDPKTGDPT
jgi:hypothetical protein